ncbi:MAG: multifunctional oxoglutarate decarboxylase/oxoglutarate dehydrogenase thiamine pyrophosphate-binding subunit/dihydrolipoyllysine-residue succinyltransferase subunit, partial [Balneolaceae bacterium]
MKELESIFGPNSALVEELYNQYQENPDLVPEHWRSYFDELNGDSSGKTNGAAADVDVAESTPKTTPAKPAREESRPKAKKSTPAAIPEGAELEKIKGVAAKIAENMDESLSIPTATSLRVLPVKMLAEDRTIINRHLLQRGEP